MSVGIALGRLTRLESEVFGKSCGVIVREKEITGSAVDRWDVVVWAPSDVEGAHYVLVGLRKGLSEKQAVPPDWQMTEAACKRLAVEYIEKLKKKGVA
nr:MAG TPA: hypothetical protein [Caudoviricetes sp.]